MNNSKLPPVVFYHDSCLDGFAAAFAAYLKLGPTAEYVAIQYDQVKSMDDVGKLGHLERDVYILDFSFPTDVFEYLLNEADRVIWIDHHKGSFQKYLKDENCSLNPVWVNNDEVCIHLNNSRSGAYLAWEYFHNTLPIPAFIRHCDDYDRYKFDIANTDKFEKAISARQPWSFEQWESLFGTIGDFESFDSKYIVHLYYEGDAILTNDSNTRTKIIKSSKTPINIKSPLDGSIKSGLAVNTISYFRNEVAMELVKESGTFGISWYINKNLECVCSIRSIGNYDVSAIAKLFGGDGNTNTAAFAIDIPTMYSWLNNKLGFGELG